MVKRAKNVLARLEDADRKNPAASLIDDLPLFQASMRAPEPEPNASEVEAMLNSLKPDDMTPREALEALYALKRKMHDDVSIEG
nr:hypothetical protein [Marinicella sp. W31]MDC2876431.1 hypothetical protein [Marinicella sp. W31]